jgi:hypothetical protein
MAGWMWGRVTRVARWMGTVVAMCGAATGSAHGQTRCGGSTLAGVVVDPTAAIIPGASLTLDGSRTLKSSASGAFEFKCISAGRHQLQVTMDSFGPMDVTVTMPRRDGPMKVVLQPAHVETTVTVGADSGDAVSTTQAGVSQTIAGEQLKSLPDDPDDLLQQLQQMAAAGGGSPGNTTIAVDGFQESSKLPPKDSIAYIKVNPDLFSAEYREPPFDGGRVEVYTKPGQSTFHGALFATNGSPWMNARDPFSTSKGAIGKQRYGFEFSGPIRKQGSDFTMTLEHRLIDNNAVVNAVTVDANGNPQTTIDTVPAAQHLWIGTIRADWQLGAKNTFTTSLDSNVNDLENVGVGGASLAETGYTSDTYQHSWRFTDLTTISPKAMHEAHLMLEWEGETDTPNSTAPQVQVAGAFTGGGATIGAERMRRFATEYDDDVVLTIKIGGQFNSFHYHNAMTTNFNGTYIFGGGTAPVLDANGHAIAGETETITGLEQYERAQLGQPGGAATDYSAVSGTPELAFTAIYGAVYVQDDWKLLPNLHAAIGLRYYAQNDPTITNGFTPRVGLGWTPDKKATWNVHAHAGMFTGRFNSVLYTELVREDGTQRVTSTVYNPVFNNPYADATPIYSMRTLQKGFNNGFYAIENVGVTKSLPGGWSVSADVFQARLWDQDRSENITSPLNDESNGPRPGAPNTDVLQVQNSGQGGGNVETLTVSQQKLKRLQFMVGGVRVNVFDDTNNDPFFTPQSSSSDAGEIARRTGNGLYHVFANGTLKLPEKVVVSTTINANGQAPFAITTGFDNNGDGDFTDRPQYAQPGTPNAIATKWGLLVNSGGTGTLPRDVGRMPWTIYMNSNVQRAFALTRDANATHPQTLTINVRAANTLNHTNVTQVGGVLGSPLFNVPYQADNGRRIEAGVRYSF